MTPAETNLATADAYYRALNAKDLSAATAHFHPEIQFISPMAELAGKVSATEAVRRLLSLLKSVQVRTKFASADQVMSVYDMEFPAPLGICRTAALKTFKDGLIARMELFFDARPFEKK
jgi:hypothetical protein